VYKQPRKRTPNSNQQGATKRSFSLFLGAVKMHKSAVIHLADLVLQEAPLADKVDDVQLEAIFLVM
jgi:hypothetical protein